MDDIWMETAMDRERERWIATDRLIDDELNVDEIWTGG